MYNHGQDQLENLLKKTGRLYNMTKSSRVPGGTKHDGDKLRMDLIPSEMIEALAQTLTFGVKKYDDNNWRKGLKFSRVRGAALRHFMAWSKGEDIDEESGLNHLEQAFTNLGFLVTYVREGRVELDDRYKGEVK